MPDVTYYESSLTGGQIERVLENAVLSSTQSLSDTAKAMARNNIGALEKKANGLSYSDMNLSVQASLNKADSSVQPGSNTLIPSGGTTGQVLKKASGTNYDVEWANESGGGGGAVTSVDGKTGAVTILPTGGTPGQVLTKATNADYSVAWANSGGGGGGGGIFYGECSTAYTASEKAVSISGVTGYINGLSVRIKFANKSGDGNLSLNINNLGANYIDGNFNNGWDSGDVVDFVFVDNRWYVANSVKASTVHYGRVKLAESARDGSLGAVVTGSGFSSYDMGVLTGLSEYNPNETHKVGERIIRNNSIYECNTDINTPESWDSSHWTVSKSVLGFCSVFRRTITLSTTWSGSDPYTQTITLPYMARITPNTKFDIQPDATVISQMIDDGVKALYIVNDNGTPKACAVGAAPTVSLTVQITWCETTEGGFQF